MLVAFGVLTGINVGVAVSGFFLVRRLRKILDDFAIAANAVVARAEGTIVEEVRGLMSRFNRLGAALSD